MGSTPPASNCGTLSKMTTGSVGCGRRRKIVVVQWCGPRGELAAFCADVRYRLDPTPQLHRQPLFWMRNKSL
jgi:hypothetical protein